MPDHVVELILDALKECQKPMQNSEILILGISYKPNVKDIQLTPAQEISRKLQELGAKIRIFDPYFSSEQVFGITVEESLENVISNVDAAGIVTGHDEFKKLQLSLFTKMRNPILIDTRGIVEPTSAKQAKLIFRGLGRGKF